MERLDSLILDGKTHEASKTVGEQRVLSQRMKDTVVRLCVAQKEWSKQRSNQLRRPVKALKMLKLTSLYGTA